MYRSIYKESKEKVNLLNRTDEKRIHTLIGEVVSDIHYLMMRYELEPLDDSVLRDVLCELAGDGFFDYGSSSTQFKKLEYIISGIERKYSSSGKANF